MAISFDPKQETNNFVYTPRYRLSCSNRALNLSEEGEGEGEGGQLLMETRYTCASRVIGKIKKILTWLLVKIRKN